MTEHDELWAARARAAKLEIVLAQMLVSVGWALSDIDGGHAGSLIGAKRHLLDAQRIAATADCIQVPRDLNPGTPSDVSDPPNGLTPPGTA